MGEMIGMVVAYQYYKSGDKGTQQRESAAYDTWARSGARMFPFVAQQTSRDLGDARACPFVIDLIDAAFASGNENIVVVCNNDIRFGDGLGNAIRESCEKFHCFWSYRVASPGGEPDGGVDLVAITRAWWAFCGRYYPDLLLGYSYWDNIIRRFMIWSGCPEGPRLYFHTPHVGIDGRRKTPGENYNQRLARWWLRQQGEPE